METVDVRIETDGDETVIRRLDMDGEPVMHRIRGDEQAARAWVDARNSKYESAEKSVRLNVVGGA